MNILILMEKFCDLNPSTGITSANSNIVGSLSCTTHTHQCFYYDEYFMHHNKPIDEFLLTYLESNRPDVIFFSYYPFPNIQHNVSFATLDKIKEMGISTIFIWFDFVHKQIKDFVMQVANHNTLNVIVDVYEKPDERFLPMWVPQDENLFCWSDNKPTNVSFIGSRNGYYERSNYLSLTNEVCISGGQREHRLSIDDYANLLKLTKISLNFPRKPDGCVQAKSRIYESMLCGCLLMECENDAITKWFEPNVHYVLFNENDFTQKINYYLNNEEERLRIAKSGYEKMKNDYSAQKWWDKVLGI